MPEETILAFDYGMRRIGAAIGNTLTRQARPLEILPNTTRVARFAGVGRLVLDWQPDRLVVGLPLDVSGGEQEASRNSRRFARQLEGRFHIPVSLVDERHSSLEAQELLGSHDPDDAMAAAVILQRYLDALPHPSQST